MDNRADDVMGRALRSAGRMYADDRVVKALGISRVRPGPGGTDGVADQPQPS